MNTQQQKVDGLEEFDSSDIIIPRRNLIQPTTQTAKLGVKAAPGSFVDKTSKKVYADPFEIVVITMKKNRVLNHPYGSSEKGYRCWSSDSKRPDADVENPISQTCASCPQAGKDLQYNLLCMDVKETKEYGIPSMFWLTCGKSSRWRAGDFVNGLMNTRTSPRARVVTIEGIQPPNIKQGNYYVVNFKDLTVLPDSLKEYVDTAVALYASQDTQTTDADEVAETADDSLPF